MPVQPDRDERILCSLLTGTGIRVPPPDREGVLHAAQRHRLEALLAHRLRETGDLSQWDPGHRERLAAAARDAALLEAIRGPELARVVEALAGDGLAAVLFKGSALGHTVYPAAHLRPRLDSDLLVGEPAVPAVRTALERAGYEPAVETTGMLVTAQCHYTRVDRTGVRHALDVHWRPFNAARFAGLLTFEEVRASARPLAAVSPRALAPAPVHALLLACVHRVVHHAESPDLLWLYDIHLLVTSLAPDARAGFFELAARRRVLAVCLRSLRAAQACFGTPLLSFPEAAPALKEPEAELAAREDVAGYLTGQRRLVSQVCLDLRALGWRARWRLVREHLLPAPG